MKISYTYKRAQLIKISPGDAGQRVDNYLFRTLVKLPKGHVYKIIRSGQVRVNSKRIKPSYKLQEDDNLRIPPTFITDDEQKTLKKMSKKSTEDFAKFILYEDDKLLIINKPSGLAVHGGSGISHGAIEMARAYCDDENVQLVHRIDRDTSGCLLLTKKRSVLRLLHELFRENKIKKEYIAILKGKLSQEGTITNYLTKNTLSSGERISKISVKSCTGAKEAISKFRIMENQDDTTLTSIRLLTGRTHQIRVQSAHLGNPIVGDDKYGDKNFNQEFFASKNGRLLLHARCLEFTLDSKQYRFVAPLDEIMTSIVDQKP